MVSEKFIMIITRTPFPHFFFWQPGQTSEQAIFHYKQNTYYNPKGQFTYTWNDSKLNIWWPVKNPILSQRDEVGHFVDK